jgi:hypothetical protein
MDADEDLFHRPPQESSRSMNKALVEVEV